MATDRAKPKDRQTNKPNKQSIINSTINFQEEPLSEEDLRALQKDRQKKDNHNMSKFIFNYFFLGLFVRQFMEDQIGNKIQNLQEINLY